MDVSKPAVYTSISLAVGIVLCLLTNAYLYDQLTGILSYAGGRFGLVLGALVLGFVACLLFLLYVLSFRPMRLVSTLVFLLFLIMTYTMTAAYVGLPFQLLSVELSDSSYYASFGPGPLFEKFVAHNIIISGIGAIVFVVVVLGVMHIVELLHKDAAS